MGKSSYKKNIEFLNFCINSDNEKVTMNEEHWRQTTNI